MNHYTVRAIKGKRCVRRVDSWTIVNARNIYERLLSEFPGALVQIYGPDMCHLQSKAFPEGHHSRRFVKRARIGLVARFGLSQKVAKLKRWGKKEGA
jgi:hypothetical protein